MRKKIIKNMPGPLKIILLCLLSPLLLWLSFPSFDLGFLAWVAFIPLFFAIADKTKNAAFWLSYLCGFIFFISVLYWLVHVTLTGLIILCLYLSFYFAFFGYFFAGFKKRIPGLNIFTVLFLSSLWIILEYIRCHLFTGFPWALLGYSQYQNTGLIQIADITGSLGVSFLVMYTNLSLFQIMKSIWAKEFKAVTRIVLVLIILFAMVYGYGAFTMNKYSLGSKAILDASLLQGNIPQEVKLSDAFNTRIKETYFELTRQSMEDKPDLIIWPETAYPDYLNKNDRYTFSPLLGLARDVQRPILFGAVLEDQGKYFNTATLIPSDLSQPVFYKKIHLVPFGEYLPLRKYLPFLVKFVPIEDFDSGREFVVFKIKNKHREIVSFGTLICFEDTIADLARQLRLSGADFLVNITNDAWFKQTSSPYQHMQASVFRAVENRVYVLRAANTGITCAIDNCGRVLNRVKDSQGKDIFVRGSINIGVKKQDSISTYTGWGDIFLLGCGIYIILFALFLLDRMSRKMRRYYFPKF